MNEIFKTEFSGVIQIGLGRYDADSQRFSVSNKDGAELGYVSVPLNDAPRFKVGFPEGIVNGKLGLLLDNENEAQAYLIAAEARLN